MSTFTDWNGPQGGGASAMDLVQLANAYSELVTKLNQHLNQTTSTDNVHQSKDYVDRIKSEIAALIPDVSSFITQLTADGRYAKLADLPNFGDFATRAMLEDYAKTNALSVYLKTNELSAQQVIRDIQSDIVVLQRWVNSDSKEIPELTANHVTGLIHAVEQVQFTDKHFAARVGGSDEIGIYYLLGMLVDKAGTAYIRMGNTKPFSAVVNFAVTPEWKGALSVTTDCELKGLKFKIVSGTGADGAKHAYLAIQSTEWISQFASTDGVGIFDSIEFDGAGINFIPVDSEGWQRPNGSTHDVCNCRSGKGFSFSELASTILGTQIYREEGNPYVTVKDITALDHIGLISNWPFYDENGVAIDVPEGLHACDGTEVLPEDDVSDEFREKFTHYPLQDFSVIKTKSSVQVDVPDIDTTAYSLAAAVCTLHGIKFYEGLGQLPDEGKIGEPVIVAMGNKFAVYVYKNDTDKWQKYSTTFNDINSTIGAVAAVIAAEHGADVYTIYNSAADLPHDSSVETGALAIVFDGAYTVFKYNGTAWEVQP